MFNLYSRFFILSCIYLLLILQKYSIFYNNIEWSTFIHCLVYLPLLSIFGSNLKKVCIYSSLRNFNIVIFMMTRNIHTKSEAKKESMQQYDLSFGTFPTHQLCELVVDVTIVFECNNYVHVIVFLFLNIFIDVI